MCKIFSLDGKTYLFTFSFDNNCLLVRLTDFITAWKAEISADSLVDKFKELNSIDANVEVEKVVAVFETDLNPKCVDVTKTVKVEEKKCNFNLSNESKDVYFNFSLEVDSAEEFYKDITLPLVLVIGELKNRERKLEKLLKEKDEEITEYQLEGAKLFRKYLRTDKFDEQRFNVESTVNMDSLMTTNISNIDGIFDTDVSAMYDTAIKVSLRRPKKVEIQHQSDSNTVENVKKSPNLKWELGPQNVKRFKTNRPKIKL